MSRMALRTLRFRALPRRAAELVERRLAGAAVFLDQVEPLDRHEQLVVAGVAELHELLGGIADADLLEPDELADAVIDVDDEVADLEIAKVGKKRLRDGAMAVAAPLDLRALFLEDVRLGDDLQLRRGKPEAFRELADGDEDGDVQQLVGAVHQHAAQVVFGEQLDRALGAAFGAGDEQHGVAALAHAAHFGDPFLNAAAKFHRRLARDVERCAGPPVRRGRVPPMPADRAASVALASRRSISFPPDEQLFRGRRGCRPPPAPLRSSLGAVPRAFSPGRRPLLPPTRQR